METLPIYAYAGFILTALLTLLLLYKASGNSRTLLIAVVGWLVLQAIITLTGFYRVTTGTPPRFALLIMPPVLVIIALLMIKKGRTFLDGFDAKTLTLLHIVRIPVELTLWLLFLHHAVPEAMTFEGRNFDVISGLTAPVIYYFGYVKRVLSRNILLLWNIICLALLVNIVVTAILSAPFAFQRLGFEQPNIALFYFPFSWLPAFVVPAVLAAHLISIRNLIAKPKYHHDNKRVTQHQPIGHSHQ